LKDPQIIYRIARKPDPWAPIDWAKGPLDPNRFDDPEGLYRVLYGCSQKLGCFVETLARFRKGAAELATKLAAIELEPEKDDFLASSLGEVPLDWFSRRIMGVARTKGSFVEICSAQWISSTRLKMIPYLKKFKLEEFDASTIQSGQREVTQRISRFVYESGADGIIYPSKHGHNFRNWAVFEPFKIETKDPEPVTSDDPDFLKCLGLLNLKLQS